MKAIGIGLPPDSQLTYKVVLRKDADFIGGFPLYLRARSSESARALAEAMYPGYAAYEVLL